MEDETDLTPEPRSFAGDRAENPPRRDGLELLRADHRQAESLVEEYARAGDAVEKVAVVERLCLLLTIHAQIEEEIFYPALRQAGVPLGQIDEAVVEHMTARQLVADLESASPEDDLIDAKVRVLGEYVRRHAEEEEADLFEAAAAHLDLQAIGARLTARKDQLCREAALRLKARLRGASGPATRMAGEHPSPSTLAMPGPFRAAAAAADLALTILPGGGRLRRMLRPERRDGPSSPPPPDWMR